MRLEEKRTPDNFDEVESDSYLHRKYVPSAHRQDCCVPILEIVHDMQIGVHAKYDYSFWSLQSHDTAARYCGPSHYSSISFCGPALCLPSHKLSGGISQSSAIAFYARE